jgi:oxygen-independent coproporphyrinogen-3 oxidase
LEYIGFGVSAGGYYNSSRYVNTKNFSYYIKQVSEGKKPYDYYKKNDKKEDLIETLFMGLRLIDGISLKKIKDKYPEYFDVVVNFLKKDNFFIVDENVRLSKKGLDYSTSSFVKILELEDLIT